MLVILRTASVENVLAEKEDIVSKLHWPRRKDRAYLLIFNRVQNVLPLMADGNSDASVHCPSLPLVFECAVRPLESLGLEYETQTRPERAAEIF